MTEIIERLIAEAEREALEEMADIDFLRSLVKEVRFQEPQPLRIAFSNG